MMQATVSQLGGRLPKQIQRALPPLCLAWVLIALFLSNAHSFDPSPDVANVFKRDFSYQSALTTAGPEFPRKIWQSWKIDPLGFEERDSTCARTWTSKNPGHRYEVLTDNNDLHYVETHFGPAGLNRPDIVHMYRSLTAKIIKADLLRYLVMYVEGGVYADIDVEALKPIDRFIPERHNERDVDMVIGVEIDQPEFKNHAILGKKSQSFCQWTFMCKPGLPVMMKLIDNIIKWLNDVAQTQHVPVSEIVLDFDEVISGTGPSAFTTAILAEMTARSGQPVDWDYFHNMAESKLVGGILVLTIEAFAAGQGHSDSGNHNARAALVKHRYHASKWPTMHPRYSHPVLGEVELCNWEPECVKIWDYNKALFESLPPEEQAKQIADKQAADALLAGSRLEARNHMNETGERNATEYKSHFGYTSTSTTKVVTHATALPYS
jgi:mannosyltransferase OCH1-like enzyme